MKGLQKKGFLGVIENGGKKRRPAEKIRPPFSTDGSNLVLCFLNHNAVRFVLIITERPTRSLMEGPVHRHKCSSAQVETLQLSKASFNFVTRSFNVA